MGMDLSKLKVVEGSRHINVEGSTLSFKVQDGPIKEMGEKGCQVDDIILAARQMIEQFNDLCPCEENSRAIAGLNDALRYLEDRKKNREKRGVEGTNDA